MRVEVARDAARLGGGEGVTIDLTEDNSDDDVVIDLDSDWDLQNTLRINRYQTTSAVI